MLALGPLSRSARDLRTALNVTAGPERPLGSAYSWTMPPPRQKRLEDFRVGFVIEDDKAPVTSEVAALLRNAVEAIKRTGVRVFGEAVNVRDGEAYKAWLNRAATSLGGCDIFVPSVSGGGGMDSEKNWVRNFEIDMLHTVRGCEAASGSCTGTARPSGRSCSLAAPGSRPSTRRAATSSLTLASATCGTSPPGSRTRSRP